jgi:hypothetical protein
MDPAGFPFARKLEPNKLCSDCTVLAGKLDIVFANGSRADIQDGVYLHHVVSMMSDKAMMPWISMCPGKAANFAIPGLDLNSFRPGASFIGGAVDEFTDWYTTPDGKGNSGYYIPKDTTVFLSGEIINYLKSEQEVYLRFDLEYLPGRVGTEVQKGALNVEGQSITASDQN